MQASPEVQELLLRINASTALLERELKKGADAIDGLGNKAEATAGRYDRSMRRVEDSTKRSQMAMRNLGFQIQDIGTSLSSGSSPFIVLAQQGGQVAGAMSEMGGIFGRVGAFLTGPLGAGLLTAGTLLGALWFNSRKAGEGATEHADALKAQGAAMDALNDLVKTGNDRMRETIDLGKQAAMTARDNAKATIEKAQAELALARARITSAQAAGRITGGRRGDGVNFGASIFESIAQGDAAAAEKAIAAAEAQLKKAEQTLANVPKAEQRLRESIANGRRSSSARASSSRGLSTFEGPIDLGKNVADPDGMAMWDATKSAIAQITEGGKQLGDTLVEQLERANEKQREFARGLADGLGNAIVNGGKLGDVLVSSLKRAAAEAISSGIFNILTAGLGLSTGGIGGFFAGLFGGKRENGGPVMPGKAYLVGEKRPELFVPNTAGRIIPNIGGMGGGLVVNVDARQAADPAATAAAVRFAVAQAVATSRGDLRLMGRPSVPSALGMGR